MSTLKRYNGTSWETIGGSITGDTLPIGSVINYTGSSAPTGWEMMNDYLLNEEIETGETWINGKKIYRLTIKYTTTVAAGQNPNLPLGIDITTVDDIVEMRTIAKQKNANVWFTASSNNSASDRLSHYINGNNMTIRNSWDLEKIIIVLEYTKVG